MIELMMMRRRQAPEDELVYSGTDRTDGRLRSLDPITRQENWSVRPYTGRGIRSIAVDKNGYAYVPYDGTTSSTGTASSGSTSVIAHPPEGGNGHTLLSVSSLSISGIACDPDGTAVYVSYRASLVGQHSVRKLDAINGGTLWTASTDNEAPFSVALSLDGQHVYALGALNLFKFSSSNGAQVAKEARGAGANWSHRITVGEQYVYTTSLQSGMQVIAHDKDTLAVAFTYNLGDSGSGVSVTPDGKVVAVAGNNGTIVKLTPDLQQIWSITSPITPVFDVKVGSRGDIYVGVGGTNSVSAGSVRVYDADGNFKHWFSENNDNRINAVGIYQPWLWS